MSYPMINQVLSTNGDGTGDDNAIGDYSVTPETFYIECPTGEFYNISRMIVTVKDTNGMSADEYGNLGVTLTNGIDIDVTRGATTLIDLTPTNITTNAGWAAYCYDANVLTWGPGNELLSVRWTFSKSGRFLTLAEGDALNINLNDDFSGLLEHRFLAQGYQVT